VQTGLADARSSLDHTQLISLLSMSDSLLIRNLPESLKPALRRRAAAHGRSVEAEARVILEEAVGADEDFISWWLDEMASVPAGEPLPMPDRGSESRETVSFE
jgi:antitoxin FitA